MAVRRLNHAVLYVHGLQQTVEDRKSTRLNSSHSS